jgi:hypothetical protein
MTSYLLWKNKLGLSFAKLRLRLNMVSFLLEAKS